MACGPPLLRTQRVARQVPPAPHVARPGAARVAPPDRAMPMTQSPWSAHGTIEDAMAP